MRGRVRKAIVGYQAPQDLMGRKAVVCPTKYGRTHNLNRASSSLCQPRFAASDTGTTGLETLINLAGKLGKRLVQEN